MTRRVTLCNPQLFFFLILSKSEQKLGGRGLMNLNTTKNHQIRVQGGRQCDEQTHPNCIIHTQNKRRNDKSRIPNSFDNPYSKSSQLNLGWTELSLVMAVEAAEWTGIKGGAESKVSHFVVTTVPEVECVGCCSAPCLGGGCC